MTDAGTKDAQSTGSSGAAPPSPADQLDEAEQRVTEKQRAFDEAQQDLTRAQADERKLQALVADLDRVVDDYAKAQPDLMKRQQLLHDYDERARACTSQISQADQQTIKQAVDGATQVVTDLRTQADKLEKAATDAETAAAAAANARDDASAAFEEAKKTKQTADTSLKDCETLRVRIAIAEDAGKLGVVSWLLTSMFEPKLAELNDLPEADALRADLYAKWAALTDAEEQWRTKQRDSERARATADAKSSEWALKKAQLNADIDAALHQLSIKPGSEATGHA